MHVLAALTVYTYAIEYVGLATGWPYGEFRYLQNLGPVLEGVPVALPLLFHPLVLNAVLLSVLLLGPLGGSRFLRLGTALAVVAVNLTFDREELRNRLDQCEFALDDLVSFTLLWGLINVAYANWIPAVLTVGLLLALATTPRFSLAVPGWLGGEPAD